MANDILIRTMMVKCSESLRYDAKYLLMNSNGEKPILVASTRYLTDYRCPSAWTVPNSPSATANFAAADLPIFFSRSSVIG
jgi:hypothetical protein